MKCVLRIGYDSFLLPDHKGVDKVIDLLSKAVQCENWYGHGAIKVRGSFEIGMSLVPESVKLEATPDLEEEMETIFAEKAKRGRKGKAISAPAVQLLDFKKGRK